MLELTLILLPLVAGLMLLVLKHDLPRKFLVAGVTVGVCVGSVALAWLPKPIDLGGLHLNQHLINHGMMLVEIAMSLFIVFIGIRAKNALVVLLIIPPERV